VSFGPLTLALAFIIVPVITLYERARYWHAEHWSRRTER
jgi:hypothetical protein